MLKFILKLLMSASLILPLYFFGKFILSNDVQISWFLWYFYLIFVLLVSPLSYIFFKLVFLKKYSNSLVSFRRPLGIIAWCLALFHGFKFEERIYALREKYYTDQMSFASFLYSSIFESTTGTILWMNVYSFWFWFGGFVIMMLLLATSNNISQKILWAKIWKYIQRLVYPLFLLVVLHIYFVWWWKGLYLYPALVLICARSYVWFDKNFQFKGQMSVSHSSYRKFLCLPCWYIYYEELWDPDGWLIPGTKFEEIPDDRYCPVCGVTKKDFTPLDGDYNPEHKENHGLDLVLRTKKYLTKDVVELSFYCEKELEIQPGQFCNLIFYNQEGKEKITRSYSVVKYRDKLIYLWIKLKSDGEWSQYIKKLQIWDTLKALWPFWDFVLKNTSNKKIFIATGTWLSPIYHMMEKAWDTPKELYFWVWYEKDLFYIKELNKIPNLKIHIYLSREDKTLYGYWRIDYKNIKADVKDEIYMCGSSWLIENLNSKFIEKGFTHIYFEKFL